MYDLSSHSALAQEGGFLTWKVGDGGKGVSLDDLASEGSPCHFCSILSVTRESQVHLDSRGGNGGGS